MPIPNKIVVPIMVAIMLLLFLCDMFLVQELTLYFFYAALLLFCLSNVELKHMYALATFASFLIIIPYVFEFINNESFLWLSFSNRTISLIILWAITLILGKFTNKQILQPITEEKWAAIWDSSPDGFMLLQNNKIKDVNLRICEILQLDKGQIVGKDILQFTPKTQQNGTRSQDLVQEKLDKVLNEGKQKFELDSYAANGEIMHLEVHMDKIKSSKATQVLCVIRDITIHILAKKELLQNKDLLDQGVRLKKLGIWKWEIATNEVAWNDQLYDIYAYEDTSQKVSFEIYQSHFADENVKKRVLDKIYHCLETGEEYFVKYHIKDKTGQIKHLSTIGKLIHDENGKPKYLYGVCSDETETELNLKKLEESTQLIQFIFDNVPQSIFWKDANFKFLGANQQFVTDCGYQNVSEIIGKTDFELGNLTETEIDNFLKIDKEVLRTGERKYGIYEAKNNLDISNLYFRITKAPLKDREGKQIGIIGTCENITEKIINENKIRASEKKFRTIWESSPEGFLILEKGLIKEINPRLSQITGFSKEELIGKNPLYFSPEYQENGDSSAKILQKRIKNVVKESYQELAWTINTQSGEKKYMSVYISLLPMDNTTYVLCAVHDVTKQILAERELTYNKNLLDQGVEAKKLGIWQYFIKEDKIIFNEEKYKIFGYDDFTLQVNLEEYLSFLIDDKEKEVVLERKGECIRTGKEFTSEYRIRDKKGKIKYISTTGKLVKNVVGNPEYIYGISTDETEHELAKQEIKESQQFLQLILDTIPQRVFWKDKDLRFLGVNQKCAEDSGFSNVEDIVGKTDFDLPWSKNEIEAFRKDDLEVMKSGQSKLKIIEPQTKKDGTVSYVVTNKMPLKSYDGRTIGVLGTYEDITDRIIAEENKIKHIQQIENKNKELEQFAYIASHDLQEPLQTLTSMTELLTQLYSDKFDVRGHQMMDYITDASVRMKTLIKGLLDYSRIGQNSELTLIDCNKLVELVQKDLSSCIAQSNAFVYIEQLPTIKGYETELYQLFQNLIGNAIKYKSERPLEIHISSQKKDKHWEFNISDNGIGIDPKFKDKIFVIFQRLHARNEYEGTGIGLAHCKKIVDLHEGKIWVDSKINEGSTFNFTLRDSII